MSEATQEKSMMQKMITGELYLASDPEIVAAAKRAFSWMDRYNSTFNAPMEERAELLREGFGEVGKNPCVRSPFYCDYGMNITLGDNVFMNFNCVILDVCPVKIGDGTMLGSGVQILAADHPRDPETRATLQEFGRPVTIGKNVWIGAGALILPGVTIGDDAIIGAGSVVTRDVAPGTTVMGNPARPKQ